MERTRFGHICNSIFYPLDYGVLVTDIDIAVGAGSTNGEFSMLTNGNTDSVKVPWELNTVPPVVVDEKPTPADVPISQLHIDHTYQAMSPRNPNLVKEIASRFDLMLFGRLRVARRANGALFVFDGRHRLEGAIDAGEFTVPCDIYDVPDRKREIELFIQCNTRLRKVPQGMLFMAEVAAGNADAVNLSRLVNEAGCAIVDSNTTRMQFTVPKLTCIAALKSLYGAGNKSYAKRATPVEHWQLREALELIAGVAPPNATVTEHAVLAFTWLLKNYPGFRTQGERLRKLGWDRIDAACRSVGPRPLASEAGEALLAVVDYKRPKNVRLDPDKNLAPPAGLPEMAGT